MKEIIKFKKIFLAAFAVIVAACGASAATFTVTNTNDSGAGSLRAALTQANANAQADTIVFDPAFFNTARTITLTSGDLQITRDGGNPVTISGPGANLLTISGGNAYRIFTLFDANGTVSGMTLRDGNGGTTTTLSSGYGGAIYANQAILTVSNVTFRNNSAIGGGGMYSAATQLSMSDALFTENTGGGNPGASGYAGFYAQGSNTSTPMTIRNTVVSNNTSTVQVGGAGIFSANVSIANLQVTGNRTITNGYPFGGLRIDGVTGTATDVTISNNTSNSSYGGMYSENSNIVFRRLTVTNNSSVGDGGGVTFSGNSTGRNVVVIDSLIANNSAPGNVNGGSTVGGGMYIGGGGTHYIVNTTIANNLAGAGGGIYDQTFGPGLVRIINSTITRNNATAIGNPSACPANINGSGGGGGVKTINSSTGRTLYQNTIVAGNTAAQPACGNDVYGTITSNGYNLIGDTTASTGFGAAGDKLNVNAQLGALQNNGGATQTIAPQAGSPAINAGSNLLAVDHTGQLLPFDQRGRCFSRFVGGTADIGAFETGATSRCNPSRFDFDADGRDDVSVFRPSNGAWYLNQSSNGFTGLAFGDSNDKLVPADYDGDGKTDVAVFRPANGGWYLQRSALGFTGISFGQTGDIPAPADYDGDGKSEIAVFRPSNGVWYLLNISTSQFTATLFGTTGDKPVAADYDGDGKTDIAVNRNGNWYIQRSQLGFTGIAFGDGNDKTVPADYDGDGKADIAVFRPSNGGWYLLQSSAGFVGIVFGLGTDSPTPADYDGDGKADVAVFRNGNWYLNRSTQGFTGIQFGAATDLPIPNSFVR